MVLAPIVYTSRYIWPLGPVNLCFCMGNVAFNKEFSPVDIKGI